MSRTKLIILSLTSFFFAYFLISGCAKYEVREGPKGVQGNENIIVKEINIIASEFTWDTVCGCYRDSQFVSEISPSVINSGGLIMYLLLFPNYWQKIPYTDTFDLSTGVNRIYNFSYALNYMYVSIAHTDSTTLWPLSNSYTYKLVIISPEARKAYSNMNWNNYDEVEQKFNF